MLASQFELKALQDATNKALQQISENQQKLGNNINQNLRAIRAAFEFSDAHFHVYRSVLDDYVMGNIQIKRAEDGTATGVDWDCYYARYNEKLKAEAAKAKEAKEAGAAEEPPADDFEFGGDYASQNHSEGPSDPGDEQGHREDLDGGRDEAGPMPEVRADGRAHQDA